MHAVYGLSDHDLQDICQQFNGLLIEWHSRKLRADPALLRAAVQKFGLKPEVYDKSSAIAFEYPPEQLVFPFTAECLAELETFMEYPPTQQKPL